MTGGESLFHKKLKSDGKLILLNEGFKENEILVDKKTIVIPYYGYNYKFRIDVYASNNIKEKAIECGNFPKWKHPIYFYKFGKDNVQHLPYPLFYKRYNKEDLEKNQLDEKQAKFFLVTSYNKFVYNEFKNDDIFDFQEFKEETREIFDVDNHKNFLEINPDFGNKKETKGKTVWMNFPTSLTLSKQEFKNDLRFGMIYYGNDIIAPTIYLSGKKAARTFLELSDDYHNQVFENLRNLPEGFFIRSGWLFWKDKPKMPFDKEYNDTIPCFELTREDYNEIIEDLTNLTYGIGLKCGPALDLAKIFVHNYELTEVIKAIKPLYKLLLNPKFKVGDIAENIKKLKNWPWYIDEKNYKALYSDYLEKYGNETPYEKFRNACSSLKKSQEYLDYISN